jgi:Flp pilus assembly protein TadG
MRVSERTGFVPGGDRLPSDFPADRSGERGAIGVLMAASLVALIGAASLAIDLGAAMVTKAELQNASDAATLAGARELSEIYRGLGTSVSYKDYALTSGDRARIRTKAAEFSTANEAGHVPVSITDDDLVLGTYDPATGDVTESNTGVRAVQLRTRRDDVANGEMPVALARVMGIRSIPIRADAAAALTPLGTLKAGKGDIPIGISQYWFDSGSCDSGDNSIKFYPTGSLEGCAGWHTYTDWPASSSRLKNILDGLGDGSFASPETIAGQTSYNFTGGTVASRFKDMKDLYDAKKDVAGDWTVNIPVYASSDCSNPSGPMLIAGFARATVYQVTTSPTNTIMARVECGIFDADDLGDGGGENDFGTLVASPVVIQ